MSIPDFVIKEWQSLKSSSKKKILRAIQNTRPKNYDTLKKKSGLGHFRDVKVVNLDLPDSSLKKLENTFLEEDGGNFFNNMIQAFFCESEKKLNQTFHELLDNSNNIVWTKYLNVYLTLNDLHRENEFLQLFFAVSVWVQGFGEKEYFELMETINSLLKEIELKSIESTLKGDSAFHQMQQVDSDTVTGMTVNLLSSFSEVDGLKNNLLADVAKLESFLTVDRTRIISDLDRIIFRVNVVRDSIAALSSHLEVEPPEWKNRKELSECYACLEMKLEESLQKNSAKEFSLEFAACLKGAQIIHRLPAKQKNLVKRKLDAVNELSKCDEFLWPVGCPVSDPDAWLTAYFTLHGEPLETFLDQLTQVFPRLAEFLSELEKQNLVIYPTKNLDLFHPAKSVLDIFPVSTEQDITEIDSNCDKIEESELPLISMSFIEDNEKASEGSPEEVFDPASDEETEESIGPEEAWLCTMNSQDLAKTMLVAQEDNESITLALQMRLLKEGQLELSYWLDRALADKSALPPALAEILQIGLQLRPGFREAEGRLTELFVQAAENFNMYGPEEHLLLTAATIRPALMAPHTHPGYLIEQLALKFSNLQGFKSFMKQLSDFVKQGVPLADELFCGLGDRAGWEARRKKLEAETVEWLANASRHKMNFNAATRIWVHWSEEDGELFNLVIHCMQPVGQIRELEAEVANWKNTKSFDDRLDRTDLQINRRAKQMPIRYSARDQLCRLVEEALVLAERWLAQHRSKPQIESGYIEHSRKGFEVLKSNAESIIKNLSQVFGEEEAEKTKISSQILAKTLEDLSKDFHDSDAPSTFEPIEHRNMERLMLPAFPSSSEGNLDLETTLVLEQIARPRSADQAIIDHLNRGFLGRARALLKLSGKPEDAERILVERQKEIRRQIEKQINAMDVILEGYLLNGAVTEPERNVFSKRIELCRKAFEENPAEPDNIILELVRLENEMAAEGENRKTNLNKRINALQDSFQEHNVDFPFVLQERLDEALAKGHLTDAEEFLALATKALQSGHVDLGLILPEIEPSNWFEIFVERLPIIQKAVLDIQTIRTLIRGANTGLEELDALDHDARSERAEVLGWWHDLSGFMRKGQVLTQSPLVLYKLLRWFGFVISNNASLVEIKKDRQGPPNFWQHYHIEALIEAPVPRFGSSAHGRHSIVLVWNKLEDDQIAQWLSSNRVSKEQPVTILYFNGLDQTSRRQVILAARRQGYSPVIVDQNLLVWLCHCMAALDRTRALFGIGLTGGHCNPYTPEVAGGVPPEMFYGRSRDIEKLWKLEGPCIIFGGRQLGKSALLQQVVRHHHRPEHDQYVLYSGAAKHSTNIWELFRQMLIAGGLLQDRAGSLAPDKIKSRIKELLDTNPSRRLLMLIDECDNLLEEDSRRQFENMSLVRDLMTETGRRFKVVLAGLHNVQRFQRIPNQPLAHFGEPICIGPLDPTDARQLAQKPLEALGYRFEPPQLVQRILANTNYHPSLIQLFCHELVDSMLGSTKGGANVPPFVIDEGFITSVYRKVSLEKKMRDRFDWTLDLDQRYRAIGYTFAWLELTERPDPACIEAREGYRVAEILSRVRDFWSKGFSETNIDELTGLLDEMVGLGVLLGITGRRYRLRSPNILRLLGGEENILAELERFAAKDFEQPYVPQVVRRILPVNDGNGVSSPLTLHQEGELLQSSRGINLLIGSNATGIDRVAAILDKLFAERAAGGSIHHFCQSFTERDRAEQIVSAIKTIYQKKVLDGSLRIIVESGKIPHEELFQGLTDLAEWLEGLRTDQRFVRIICLLEPFNVLALRSERKGQHLLKLPGVSMITLRRWSEAAQRHWFNDINRIPADGDQPKRWIQRTGGWPMLTEQVQKAFLEKHLAEPDIQFDRAIWVNHAGLSIDPDLATTFQILTQLGSEVDLRDLTEFAIEEGVPKEKVPVYAGVLLDLELAVGTTESMRAEPFAASAFAEI